MRRFAGPRCSRRPRERAVVCRRASEAQPVGRGGRHPEPTEASIRARRWPSRWRTTPVAPTGLVPERLEQNEELLEGAGCEPLAGRGRPRRGAGIVKHILIKSNGSNVRSEQKPDGRVVTATVPRTAVRAANTCRRTAASSLSESVLSRPERAWHKGVQAGGTDAVSPWQDTLRGRAHAGPNPARWRRGCRDRWSRGTDGGGPSRPAMIASRPAEWSGACRRADAFRARRSTRRCTASACCRMRVVSGVGERPEEHG